MALSTVRVSFWVFSRRNDITHKCLATSTGKKQRPSLLLTSSGPTVSEKVKHICWMGNWGSESYSLAKDISLAGGKVALSFRLQVERPLSALSSLVSTTSQEPFCSIPSSDAGGSWVTAGCSVLARHPDSTMCLCNHSTSFAILLQVYEVQVSREKQGSHMCRERLCMRPIHTETLHWTLGGWSGTEAQLDMGLGENPGGDMMGCQIGLRGAIGSRTGVQGVFWGHEEPADK